VLRRLRGAGIILAEVLGQYHARGVVSLRRRPLRLCEMTADRPLDGDRDRAVPLVAARGPPPRGTGNREVNLLVATIAAAVDGVFWYTKYVHYTLVWI
jgi:hypothetical protein